MVWVLGFGGLVTIALTLIVYFALTSMVSISTRDAAIIGVGISLGPRSGISGISVTAGRHMNTVSNALA